MKKKNDKQQWVQLGNRRVNKTPPDPTTTPRQHSSFTHLQEPARYEAYSRCSINDYNFYYSKTCLNLAIWSQARPDC